MFRTPPLKQDAQFSTPAKQISSELASPVEFVFDDDDVKINQGNQGNHGYHGLPTPQTPFSSKRRQSSIISIPKGGGGDGGSGGGAVAEHGLKINTTTNEFQYYKENGNYTPNSSPLTSSPVSLFSNESILSSSFSPKTSTGSDSHEKYLPNSSVLTNEEVLKELEDYIIDPNFKFEILTNQIIGKGSFSTVVKGKLNQNVYAIKIPSSIRNCKPIYREALNYKIISSYLSLHDFNFEEFPILNVYGLTYLTKANFPKLRMNEIVPCLVSTNLSSNLETLIKRIPIKDDFQLHIGENLWWKLAKELIMGLIVLRDCDLIHLDLKTSNILYESETEEFKIGDFTSAGLKNDILKEFYSKKELGLSVDITLQYASPELIDTQSNSPPSFQSDLYAVGLILLTSAIGQEPYSEVLNNHDRSSFIYLTECIKKNKIMDLLSIESWKILKSNPDVLNLIKLILIDRIDLDQVLTLL